MPTPTPTPPPPPPPPNTPMPTDGPPARIGPSCEVQVWVWRPSVSVALRLGGPQRITTSSYVAPSHALFACSASCSTVTVEQPARTARTKLAVRSLAMRVIASLTRMSGLLGSGPLGEGKQEIRR